MMQVRWEGAEKVNLIHIDNTGSPNWSDFLFSLRTKMHNFKNNTVKKYPLNFLYPNSFIFKELLFLKQKFKKKNVFINVNYDVNYMDTIPFWLGFQKS